MLPLGCATVIEHVVEKYEGLGVGRIVIVTGYNASELKKTLNNRGVGFVYNPDFETTSMFYSAKLGFRAVEKGFDSVFFQPADVPLVRRDTLMELLDAMHNSGKEMAIPEFNGVDGHPVLFSRECIGPIIEYMGDSGLKGAIKNKISSIIKVPVSDDGVLYDIDTNADYERIRKLFEERKALERG